MTVQHDDAVPAATAHGLDWVAWLRRWDAQQTGYLPDREGRFNAMLDVLGALLPASFVALDLACGPGSISERLLARFPEARVVALDLDPVLLALGRGALGTVAGRLRWVEADLSRPRWLEALGEARVDAVLSTTALHWLSAKHLVHLYQQLATLLPEGGIFLNGDHMAFSPPHASFQRAANAIKERRHANAFTEQGGEDWARWWNALEQEPGTAELFAERARRFPSRDPERLRPNHALHEAALLNAGFREVGTIWQNLDNRVLMAIR